ncbi:regulatory protein GemA [uncultured Gilvimarinus sp.]|uniref:gp16 family protein n=1 Tax=uncultured Gilvimarinus sp. TaxID=1689143 RepID=UPI0030D936D5
MAVPKKSNERTTLIRLIHVGRREIGMDDESYRMMLASMPALGGRTSSADLSIRGLRLVLDSLKAKGFKIRSKAKPQSRTLADDSQSKLIRHLWLQLADDGVVRDRSETALAHFVCRMVKIEALQWLTSDQASKVIEHLKGWMGRVANEKRAKGEHRDEQR